jgi:hypothetical protein
LNDDAGGFLCRWASCTLNSLLSVLVIITQTPHILCARERTKKHQVSDPI